MDLPRGWAGTHDRAAGRMLLRVDADSPTAADRLHVSMRWATRHVTESWHRNLPIP